MADAKRVLVTGVGTGIGHAVAGSLLAHGWAVLGIYNTSSGGAQQLASDYDRLELLQADLSDPAGLKQVIESAKAYDVNALVNNAGIVQFEEPGLFDADLWRKTFAVNLFAPAELAYELGREMATGSGIINVTSTDGVRGSYSSPAYAASKAALTSVTQSLANVLGPKGIRVNAISPGWIETSMADKAAEHAAELTPLERLGTGEEVASCVRWLLSDEASFVHGSVLTLDGGLINVDYVLLKESQETE